MWLLQTLCVSKLHHPNINHHTTTTSTTGTAAGDRATLTSKRSATENHQPPPPPPSSSSSSSSEQQVSLVVNKDISQLSAKRARLSWTPPCHCVCLSVLLCVTVSVCTARCVFVCDRHCYCSWLFIAFISHHQQWIQNVVNKQSLKLSS